MIRPSLRWRDVFNPLRGLSMSRAVWLREAFDRGEMADIQWTFRSIERSDADLLALVERRTASILEMDWVIKTAEPHAKHAKAAKDTNQNSPSRPLCPLRGERRPDDALAEEQKAALKEAYEKIENLYEAIEHLSLAVFRGYAHLQKQDANGELANGEQSVRRLAPVDQWNVVRQGTRGDWKYNPEALSTAFIALPDSQLIDPGQFIILEHPRPIDFYALPKFVRTSLGEKDWTAFAEIYGIPSGIVILPPNVPAGKEDEYAEKAQSIAEGGSGALPNGSDYKPNESARGANPFRSFLDYFTEKLVLVGTGGLLTMLTQSGSGTLAGSAHADTFRTIARGQARRISEALQDQFDKPLLEALFPGKPVLAYFELNFAAETETSEIVDNALKLSQAGYTISAEELSEKTGYELTEKVLGSSFQVSGAGVPGAGPEPSSLKPKTQAANAASELAAIKNRIAELRRIVSSGQRTGNRKDGSQFAIRRSPVASANDH